MGEGARSALVTRTLVGGESGEQFSWLDWPIGAEESAVMILHFRRGPLQSTVELLWPDARTGEVLDAAERLTAAAVGVL